MDRPRSGWRNIRRKVSSVVLAQSHQTLPGGTSTDGDYVVLREIREKRLAEKRNKKQAVEAFNTAFLENNPSSLGGITEVQGIAEEEKSDFTQTGQHEVSKDELFREIENDNVEKVQSIIQELKNNGVNCTEDSMKTARKMNILHYALDNGSSRIAQYLIQTGRTDLLSQEFEVTVKGIVSARNTLHLITIKMDFQLAKILLGCIKDPAVKQRLLYNETAMEITGQRPRTFTCLHIAAFHGSTELVELFLQHGVPVNHLNSKNDTALLWASRWGHTNVIKTLIARGAKANIENDKGSTALYWAVRYNHFEAVKLLTTDGFANVNQVRKVGLVAPIILASALGYTNIVRLLLDAGANVNMEIRGGETPLVQAAREGHPEVTQLLLERNASVDKQDERGDTSLTIAAKFNQPDVVTLLLKAGASITHKNHEGFGAWHYSICSEENDVLLTMVKFFFNKTHSPSSEESKKFRKPPLCIAASVGQWEKIKYLISVGLNPMETDVLGNNMLHHAAINDHYEVIKNIHSKVGINVQNKAGDTPLHIACLNGHSDCISVLLECKAKANIKNNRGDTALHIMARSPNTKPSAVAMLMDYMIKTHAWDSLHVQDLNGNSALHEAAAHASCDVLWEYRSLSFKQKNNDGNTPLHIAVRPNHPEILNTMLEIFETQKRDADINERNNKRETVLHLAALSGFTTTTATLVRFGADLSAQDADGNTVFHVLAIAANNDAESSKRYMDVMDVLLDELVRWWCFCNELIYPDDDKVLYRRIKREAVHTLTNDIPNRDGLSVLTLAAKLGAKNVLEKILMMPFVNYIVKDKKAYLDITHLTPQTLDKDERPSTQSLPKLPTASVSCMEWLISMNDPHKAGKTFDVPSLRQVEKIYGGICAWTYSLLMVLHLLYMGAFTGIAVSLLQEARIKSGSMSGLTIAMYVIVPLEPGFILMYMIYLLIRTISTGDFSRKSQLMRGTRPLQALVVVLTTYLPIVSSVLYSGMVITWMILFSSGYVYNDYFLAISLLFGWLFSIFFTRGFKAVNYFWKMLQLMIVRDVFRFMFIYVFILLAFSFAIHSLLQVSNAVADLYPNALDTIFMTFNLMLGMDWLFDGEVQTNLAQAGRSSVPLKVIHIIYVILTTIILLNVLIAMMNDSYQNIRLNQTVTWRVDAVRLGLEIETMMPWASNIFGHIKIKQGDILLAHRGLPAELTHDDVNNIRTSGSRWYVEIPVSFVDPEGSDYDEDLTQQISALNRRVETLENRLLEALEQTQQCVKDLQDNINPGETTLGL